MVLEIAKLGNVYSCEGEEYYYFTYDLATLKLLKNILFITHGKTSTKSNLYAATTEIECIDEIARLKLT